MPRFAPLAEKAWLSMRFLVIAGLEVVGLCVALLVAPSLIALAIYILIKAALSLTLYNRGVRCGRAQLASGARHHVSHHHE